MSFTYRIWHGSLAFFIVLLVYFTWSYNYYPGLELQLSGELEADISGKVFWDYGYGFNDLDSIELDLSADGDISELELGEITISPAGFKSDNSRGYLAWLVISEEQYNSGDFSLSGKHHWGRWMNITKFEKGRQLALYPGTEFKVMGDSNRYRFMYFRAPQAGYFKVHSENGPNRYYDGYGKNPKWSITSTTYAREVAGEIKFHADPFRNPKNLSLKLPQQKLEALKIDFSVKRIHEILPYSQVKIQQAAKLSSNSDGQVHLESLYVNGIRVTGDDPRIVSTGDSSSDEFVLAGPEDYILINGEMFSYEIVLADGGSGGDVAVFNDGEPAEISEHNQSGVVRRISKTAPIQFVGSTIESCEIQDKGGKRQPVTQTNMDASAQMTLNLEQIPQARFNGILLFVQVLLTTILALAFHCVYERIHVASSIASSSSLFRQICIDKKRWFFWVVLLCGVTVNMLYLAADWPGSMTPDSVFTHTELKRLQFTNHHPYSYSFIILVLHQLYDAPVTVAVFQILVFHTLCASLFYVLYRQGVKLYFLIPLYVLIPLSIPTNLLNITIWKDIPYSLVVLFWALFLTYLFCMRLYGDRPEMPGFWATVTLAFLFMLLCTLRHNGIVYLPFIPLALLFICRVPTRWWLRFCTLSAALLLLYYYVLPPLVLQKKPQLNNYAQQETTKYLGEMASISKGDEQSYLENYLAERTRKFVSTLGTSAKASTWYNDMHAPPQRWFSVEEARGEMASAPLSNSLASLLREILKTREYTGLFSGRFVYWNSLFALLGLIAVFGMYKWLPLSAFYSAFFLYQGFFMYFVVWERWRYLYFIYLGGLFLLPIVALEISKRRNAIVFP